MKAPRRVAVIASEFDYDTRPHSEQVRAHVSRLPRVCCES